MKQHNSPSFPRLWAPAWRLLYALIVVWAVACPTAARAEKVHVPAYYEDAARVEFQKGRWEEGRKILEKGMETYPDVTTLNELMGRYYMHYENYDHARYYLVRALRDNDENVTARYMLVDVEQRTGNYSSAICYVNELLEGEPYEEGLWTRKINLYRLQGNDEEADRLLRRLFEIYPNDTVLKAQYVRRLEDLYEHSRSTPSKKDAIKTLSTLIDINPDSTYYYYDLANLYLQSGNEEAALNAAGQGLGIYPGSTALIVKKASILAEQRRIGEALSFLRESMKVNRSAQVQRLYNDLWVAAAENATLQDPYIMYGKVYEMQHGEEALTFMLNNSITRNYYDDALYYINEAKKRHGETEGLLYKQYIVTKRMGEPAAANALLYKMYARFPDNQEIATDLAMLQLNHAAPLMTDGLYEDAMVYLDSAVRVTAHIHPDPDNLRLTALSRLFTCQLNLKRYPGALRTLSLLEKDYPEQTPRWTLKRADLYTLQGRPLEALNLLGSKIEKTAAHDTLGEYRPAFEAVALPYIKRLIDQGAFPAAYTQVHRLMELVPEPSPEALSYAMTTSALTGRQKEYDRWVKEARRQYPHNLVFLAKDAELMGREGHRREALTLLRHSLDSVPGDQTLIAAYSAISEDLAMEELKRRETRRAMVVLDSALIYDGLNRMLLFDKGLVYEKEKRYDSAYVFQKNYQPTLLDFPEIRQRLKGLQARCARNIIGVEYLQGRYGQEDIITSVATASYSRLTLRNTWNFTLNYAGRDGNAADNLMAEQVPGGVGVQGMVGVSHVFSPKWTGEASAAVATRYFPSITLSAGLTRFFPNGWEATGRIGYRRISTYKKTFRWDPSVFDEATQRYGLWVFDGWDKAHKSLLSASVGGAKSLDEIRFALRLDGMYMASKFYVNAVGDLKYFPIEDGETYVGVLGAVGTAPEASLIDNAMPASFSRLNTMVGLGGRYLLTRTLSIGALGTWHTFYSQANGRKGEEHSPEDYTITTYKNLFNICVQVYVKF